MDAHRGHEPVSKILLDSGNAFMQVPFLQSYSKTLLQVKQSFAHCSMRIGSWKGGAFTAAFYFRVVRLFRG
jgi:hypothetical protein